MKTLIITTIFAILVGCGSKNSSDSSAAFIDPLSGNWKKSCEDMGTLEVDFVSGVSTLKSVAYSDADCKDELVSAEEKRVYTVSDGKIDYVFQTVTMTIVDQTTVDTCNTTKCYGKDNWALNVPQSVAGLAEDSTSAVTYSAGEKLFQIFKITGKTLQFGDTSGKDNGSTSKLRPTQYSSVIFGKM